METSLSISQVNKVVIDNSRPPLDDHFEIIFGLLSKALKQIRKHNLREVIGLNIDQIQRSYEEIGFEIRQLGREDHASASQLKALASRIDSLAQTPLVVQRSTGTFMLECYSKLRHLYREELEKISTKKVLLQANHSEEFPGANFLGLLSDGFRVKELDRELHLFLNSKMREGFEEALTWIKNQYRFHAEKPTCFICFNTDEKDVRAWLEKILIPDLKLLGVKPVCSIEYLKAGSDLEKFQARAGKEDFSIVICTPELYKKYRSNPQSGVAVEIGHMQARFKQKPGTTVPLFFKKSEGADFNDANPFRERSDNPFAVRAPFDNYAGILELFVTLLEPNERVKNRKIAQEGISIIKSIGMTNLEELLREQQSRLRSLFNECLTQFENLTPLSICILYDDQPLTEHWFKTIFQHDLNRLNLQSCCMSKSEFFDSIEKGKKFDFIFTIQMMESTVSIGIEQYIQKDDRTPELEEALGRFACRSIPGEDYFRALLSIFALIRGHDLTDLFIEEKNAALKKLGQTLCEKQQTIQFGKANREQLYQEFLSEVKFSKTDQPETISQRLIIVCEQLGDITLSNLIVDRGWFSQAKQWFQNAHLFASAKCGSNHSSTLALHSKLAEVLSYGECKEALNAYEMIVEAKEKDYFSHIQIARLLWRLKQMDQAKAKFIWITSQPNVSLLAYIEYGNFLVVSQQYEEAIPSLIKVINDFDDGSEIVFGVMDLPLVHREIKDLIIYWKRIKISSQHLAFYLLAIVLCQFQQKEDALRIAQQFDLSLHFNPSSMGYTLLGLLYRNRFQMSVEAENAFTRSLKLNPHNYPARKHLAE